MKLSFLKKVKEKTTAPLNMAKQGIIDPTGTETRQIFSSMFVIAKIFEELFTST